MSVTTILMMLEEVRNAKEPYEDLHESHTILHDILVSSMTLSSILVGKMMGRGCDDDCCICSSSILLVLLPLRTGRTTTTTTMMMTMTTMAETQNQGYRSDIEDDGGVLAGS